MISNEIITIFPNYKAFRDPYYDDSGNDVTPVCIELSSFADYSWIQSNSWTDIDFQRMWGLMQGFLARGDRQLDDCIETAFMESLEERLTENPDIVLVKRWISNMPEFAYVLSLEWREMRNKLRM